MVGEGYEDDVTLDNIGSVLVPIDPEKEIGNMAEDDVPGKAIKICYIKCGLQGCCKIKVRNL